MTKTHKVVSLASPLATILTAALICRPTSASELMGANEFNNRNGHVAVASALPLGLTRQALQGFDSAFSAISQNARVTIVAEGVPLHQILSDAEADDLEKWLTSSDQHDQLSLIAAVSLAFDYDAETADDHTIILRKRYSDPNDLPCVTYAEVVRDLRSILSVTDLYAPTPDIDWTNNANHNFDSSLTAMQNKIAETPDGADITLADLGPEQRRLAIAASRQAILGSKTDNLRRVLMALVELKSPRTVFKWADSSSGPIFVYEGRLTPSRQIVRRPLEPVPVNLANQPPVVYGGNIANTPHMHNVIVQAPQLTPPTPLDRALAPGMLSNRLPSTVVLDALAAKIKAAHPGDIHIAVDSSVGQKPVCVFGIGFTHAASALYDVASVYGLDVTTTGAGRYSIGLPRVRSAKIRPGDVGAISRLTPPSLVRYVEGQARVFAGTFLAEKRTLRTNIISPATHQFFENVDRNGALAKGLSEAEKAFFLTANRRLLVLAKPCVPSPSEPAVSVSSVGPEALRLLTLMMLSGQGIHQLIELQKFHEPYSLGDTTSMHIRLKMRRPPRGGTVYDNQFGYFDASGTFVREGMIGCWGTPPP